MKNTRMANMSDHLNLTLMTIPNCSYFTEKYLRDKVRDQCLKESGLSDAPQWGVEDIAPTNTEAKNLKKYLSLRKCDNLSLSSFLVSNTAIRAQTFDEPKDSNGTESLVNDTEKPRENNLATDDHDHDDIVDLEKDYKVMNRVLDNDVNTPEEPSNTPPSAERLGSHRILNVISSVMLMTMIYFLYTAAQNTSTDTLTCQTSRSRRQSKIQINAKDADDIESQPVDDNVNKMKKKRFRGRRGSRRGQKIATAQHMESSNRDQEVQNEKTPQNDISHRDQDNHPSQDIRRGRGGRGHRGRRRANNCGQSFLNKANGRS